MTRLFIRKRKEKKNAYTSYGYKEKDEKKEKKEKGCNSPSSRAGIPRRSVLHYAPSPAFVAVADR